MIVLITITVLAGGFVYWLLSGLAAAHIGALADRLMPDDEREFHVKHEREHWD